MNIYRITEDDLEWWLDRAPTLNWIFAKTYAETAPHSYIVSGRTAGLTKEDFVRAGAVIRTFGDPAKFYGMTNIYLTSRDGAVKWWTMDVDVAGTNLVNQAAAEDVYGVQNAPSTRSSHRSVYNEIATQYDTVYSPVDGDERAGLLRHLKGRFDRPPLTLDIGCGTGAVLDLRVTTADRYVALDPSQAMLNELLIKQRGKVAEVIPMRIEDAVVNLGARNFDLVIAAFGSASYFDPAVIQVLTQMNADTIVLMAYRNDYNPDYYLPDITFPSGGELRSALTAPSDAQLTSIGKFDVLTVRTKK